MGEWLKNWKLIKKDAHESLTQNTVYRRLYNWWTYKLATTIPKYKRRDAE